MINITLSFTLIGNLFVIPACPESFLKMDSRQAGVTDVETTMQVIPYAGDQ
jgi:hypothetical protein